MDLAYESPDTMQRQKSACPYSSENMRKLFHHRLWDQSAAGSTLNFPLTLLWLSFVEAFRCRLCKAVFAHPVGHSAG